MTVHHDYQTGMRHGAISPAALSISLALFGILTYALCIAIALVIPAMAESMKVLYPAIFPGFVWLTGESIVLGGVLILLASAYVGCSFALIYNAVCRQLPR